MILNKNSLHQAILGSFDGLVSSTGVICGALIAAPTHVVQIAAGGAVAATISMAAGEYASDDDSPNRKAQVIAMGVATFIGSFIAAVPYAFAHGTSAIMLAVLFAVLAAGVIAEVRLRNTPKSRLRCWTETFGLLIFATAAACAAVFIV